MDDPTERKLRFAEHLRSAQVRLSAYIYSLVRDLNDTDDLYQQTAMVLWDKFDAFDGSRSFTAWACGVARWEVSNFIRSRSRRKLYLSDDLSLLLIDAYAAMDEREPDDRREALSDCVKKLRERDRELLMRCYAEDDRITAVADEMKRSSQSVHNSLKRIREALYECVRRTLAAESAASTGASA